MAQTDYFLKLEGDVFKGESSDDTHKDEIDVLSWSWGETNTAAVSSGGLGAGKVMMQDFNVVMNCCKATPELMLACAAGTHIKSALLTCRRAGDKPVEYLKITMTDCIVSSYQTGGSAGDIIPVDQFSLAFQKVEWEYIPQDEKGAASGKVKAGWDVGKNVKV